MSANNDNLMKNVGAPAPYINPSMVSQSMPLNHHQPYLISQTNLQSQGSPQVQGHFQLSEPQAQASAQSQYARAHAQVQANAAHAKFQAHLQSQPQFVGQLQNAGSSPFNPSSPAASTPATGSTKRTTHKPPSRPPGSANTNMGSLFKTMELTPAVRRKKPRHSEKQIPDKVAALLPESALYTQLLEFENRVDAALLRKKVDIQETLKNPPHIQKTLRIYVFHTSSNQTQTIPDTKNTDPPSWTLRMIGRILEEGVDPISAGMGTKSSSSYPKFSYFFKRITIYLDQSLYPENHVILWEHARSPVLHDGFELKRKWNKEFTARLRLEMNYVPEKFKLSPVLTEVLGTEVDTRQRVIAALWHYVKSRKLQASENPSFFFCDPLLRKVFGEEKMKFSMVPLKISAHLSSLQPIHLEHKITLSGNSPSGNTCYDVLVDAPFPIGKEMSTFLANAEKQRELDVCNEAIFTAIRKINEHNRRRAFFLGFSQSPAEFVNTLITSQSKDLKFAAGNGTRNGEQEHRSDSFSQPWVEDAVIRYLNRDTTGGGDGPGST